MKYMESCRQTLVQLSRADEIKMNYKDIDRIRDFITDTWTCTVDIIIYITKEEQETVDWAMLKSYHEILSMTIAIEDTFFAPIVQQNGFKWFWSYPVSTFWELRGLLDLGVSQVLVDAPIFFEMPTVYEWCKGKAEIRCIANQCYNKYMPRKDGVCGVYIRPEDIPYYEPFVSHIEFITETLTQERAYIRIYKDQGLWPGNLNILLPNFGIDVDNRGFDATFGKRRLTCRQRCQSTGRCRYCYIQVDLINAIVNNMDWLKEQLN